MAAEHITNRSEAGGTPTDSLELLQKRWQDIAKAIATTQTPGTVATPGLTLQRIQVMLLNDISYHLGRLASKD